VVYRAGDTPIVHNAFWRALWGAIVLRSSHFVADSHFIEKALLDSGVAPEQVSVIYAPPPTRKNVVPVRLPETLRGDGLFRFIYVGRIEARKGVGLLVDAFRAVLMDYPECRLIIAGPISSWAGDLWARKLRDDVERDEHLSRAVAFVGQVEDVPGLMKQCDVHVCPSIVEEAYGLVVVEAKSVGIPSVVFPSGGLPELVRDGIDGVQAADKTLSALEEALRSYLGAPLVAAQQGAAARASLHRFGFDSFEDRWVGVYRQAFRS
jgi:glycosyltransferase involved in cell wall biosynthesis